MENVVVAALQFEFLQSGALLNEARINDFLRETGLPSVYATIHTKQSSQRSCLFPTTIHFGDFTNRCPLSHLQNLVFLVIPLIAEKEDSQFTFQWNHGFRVQLYVVRVQPESELRLCVPSGLLLWSRQQGLHLVLHCGCHQVQVCEGGQDLYLLWNRQLQGNPEKEDQDHVQHLCLYPCYF